MLAHLPLPALLAIFALAAAAVWFAGPWLAKTTDHFAGRLNLGHAFGGLVILAVATNLPEVAIVVSAARAGRYDVVTGSLLGSIAAQTAVLAVVDAFVNRDGGPLTTRAASLELVLEGVLVMAMLGIVVMATQLPPRMLLHFTTPSGLLILVAWIAGVAALSRARRGLPWEIAADRPAPKPPPPSPDGPMRHALPILLGAAALTLAGGFALEQTGDVLAGRFHLAGLVFGATALAAVGSLPELSSCLAAARSGQETLAVSDVLGGHVFLPVLFVVGAAVADHTILAGAANADVYLTALGIVMTAVFVYGLIFRPCRQVLRMGVDSFVVLLLYAGGMVGLVALAQGAAR